MLKKVSGFLLILSAVVSMQIIVLAQPAERTAAEQPAESIILDYLNGYYSQVFGFNVPEIFNQKLYDTLCTWFGTPYRYAGKSMNGIDCSGFVNIIYQKVYGILLSGNSLNLYNGVHRLKKSNLQEGDLVFFKTQRKCVSHVGLYLGENKFVHSSRSNGVMVSDLDDLYYKKRFAGGGRVSDKIVNR